MKQFCLLLTSCLLLVYCNPPHPRIGSRPKPSFKQITGIDYTEVKRKFETGVSFNDQGYQLHPSWRLHLLTNDSVKLYNPQENRYYNFHVHFDHDSVINMARVWLKVKHVSVDSLIFQVLRLDGKVINDERSSVFMTFYSNKYIKEKLKTIAEILKNPSLDDTLFIKSKVISSRTDLKNAFAATSPVKFQSKSPILKVMPQPGKTDAFNFITESDDYLLPQFNIEINKAYNDFNYSFSVIVDEKGKLHFRKSLVYLMPEFEQKRIEIMKGITDVYLQNLLKITPGSTLGIPHASIVEVYVKGIKK
ncbi:MAG: hypothetical protein JWN56_3076 [Sphingobacteriales bacterium]|nr:hypothetical protein [Sphingobacteriales bacterium]